MKECKAILCCALALLTVILTLPLLTVGTSAVGGTVPFTCPAIAADAGDSVDLSGYSVEFTDGSATLPQNIEWSSQELTLSGSRVTPPGAGVFRLTAKKKDAASAVTKTVYIVAKNKSDSEYVLYSNDFSSTSLSDFKTVQQTSGAKISVGTGRLLLDASNGASSYIRLLLPDFLSDFGDYCISASVTALKAVDNTKWFSLMYRVQNNNFPYWQMCVRQNAAAANGTEIAERTADNAWSVTQKGSFTEALSPSKQYELRAEVSGGKTATYINGKKLLYSDTVTYKTGAVGLQVRGMSVAFDNVKVTLQTEQIKGSDTSYYSVREPESNIILPPVQVTYINSAERLNGILSPSPAVAVMCVDSALKVSDGMNKASFNAQPFSTVDEVMKKLGGCVIPAFYVRDSAAVRSLCDYLRTNGIYDAFIISDTAEYIKQARDSWLYLRGILDCTETTGADVTRAELAALRAEANRAGAKVMLLSQSAATRSNVEYLQRLLMTVWVNQSTSDALAELTCITSGANGIVGGGSLTEKQLTEIFTENTMVRPVNIIGHRGVPSLAQENSLAGAKTAYESGASMIENDIYITRDGVIVVMHDTTLDRTTNGSGNVESMTYAALQKIVIDVNKNLPTEPIPTLEDYFKEFKGKDVQILVEIKTNNAAIIEPLVLLIRQYNIEDQVNVIAFNELQMKRMRDAMPEMSVGYLASDLIPNESEPTASLERIMEKTQTFGTTYHPSYHSGAVGPKFLAAASYRGLTVWPWTMNTEYWFYTYFISGIYGITTNFTQYSTELVKYINAPASHVTVSGDGLPFEISKTDYGRVTSAAENAELVTVSAEGCSVSYENGILRTEGSGEALVMFRLPCKLWDNWSTYYLYTQPVSVKADNPAADTTTAPDTLTDDTLPDTDTDTAAHDTTASSPSDSTTEPGGKSSGCGSAVAACFGILMTAAAVILVKKKK